MVLIPIEVNDIEADMNLVSVSICVVPYNVKGFTKGNYRNIKDNCVYVLLMHSILL